MQLLSHPSQELNPADVTAASPQPPVAVNALPVSTYIASDGHGTPAINIYRAQTHLAGMAFKLNLYSGNSDVGTWLSVSQARQLAAALSAHADAFEAQFPAEVAA